MCAILSVGIFGQAMAKYAVITSSDKLTEDEDLNEKPI